MNKVVNLKMNAIKLILYTILFVSGTDSTTNLRGGLTQSIEPTFETTPDFDFLVVPTSSPLSTEDIEFDVMNNFETRSETGKRESTTSSLTSFFLGSTGQALIQTAVQTTKGTESRTMAPTVGSGDTNNDFISDSEFPQKVNDIDVDHSRHDTKYTPHPIKHDSQHHNIEEADKEDEGWYVIATFLCCFTVFSIICYKCCWKSDDDAYLLDEDEMQREHDPNEIVIRLQQYEQPTILVVKPEVIEVDAVKAVPAIIDTNAQKAKKSRNGAKPSTPMADAFPVCFGTKAKSIWASDNSTDLIGAIMNEILEVLESMKSPEHLYVDPVISWFQQQSKFFKCLSRATMNLYRTIEGEGKPALDVHTLSLLSAFDEQLERLLQLFEDCKNMSSEMIDECITSENAQQQMLHLQEVFEDIVMSMFPYILEYDKADCGAGKMLSSAEQIIRETNNHLCESNGLSVQVVTI